jgi:hypothetical protein
MILGCMNGFKSLQRIVNATRFQALSSNVIFMNKYFIIVLILPFISSCSSVPKNEYMKKMKDNKMRGVSILIS